MIVILPNSFFSKVAAMLLECSVWIIFLEKDWIRFVILLKNLDGYAGYAYISQF